MTGSATVGSGPRGEFKIDVKASTDFEYDYTFIDTNAGKGCFDVNIPYIADRLQTSHITDICGTACALYRRSTAYVRLPTTLIGKGGGVGTDPYIIDGLTRNRKSG